MNSFILSGVIMFIFSNFCSSSLERLTCLLLLSLIHALKFVLLASQSFYVVKAITLTRMGLNNDGQTDEEKLPAYYPGHLVNHMNSLCTLIILKNTKCVFLCIKTNR